MSYKIHRYVGIGIEDEFGEEVDADVHVDIASSDLDAPSDTQITKESSMSRSDAGHRPGPYTPEGGLEYAFDVNTIAYLLHLVLGEGETEELTDEDFDFEHTFTPVRNDLILPSSTIHVGKDVFEHIFAGCVIGSMTLSLDDEFAMVDLDVVAKKDSKGTLTDISELSLPEAYPIAFHELQIEMGPKDGTQEERVDIESIEISIANNADAEAGITLGSRYPRRIFAGDLEITVSMDIQFSGTQDLESFWGASDGPSDVETEEQNITFTFDGGTYGNLTFNLPQCIFESISTQPSGSDRIVQSAELRAFYDEDADAELIATLQNDEEYDFLNAA